MIQTGLSEEILFRGFLGKRLIAKFGFAVGNVVQGLLFGTLHGGYVFLCDYAVEGFVNYFDYGVQRVAAGVDDGEGSRRIYCAWVDGAWGGESGAFYGAGFWVAVMIRGDGQGRWRCLPPRFTLRLTQSAALIWRSLRLTPDGWLSWYSSRLHRTTRKQ